jgi:hypothetical protein
MDARMTTTPDTNHYSKSEAELDSALESRERAGDYCHVCGWDLKIQPYNGLVACHACNRQVHTNCSTSAGGEVNFCDECEENNRVPVAEP